MNKKYLLSGLISGTIFLIINQPMLLLFSLFLLTLSFQNGLQKINSKIKMPLILKLIIFMIFIGFLTEFFAIWNTLNLTPEEIMATNQLYSANPLTDIILGWGYYIPLAIIWFYLLKKYDYKIRDVFITMGIFGILFEGQGVVLSSLNPLMWFYAFLVHGSYLTITYIITKQEFPINRKQLGKIKKYFYGFLYSLLTFIPFLLWESIVKSLI